MDHFHFIFHIKARHLWICPHIFGHRVTLKGTFLHSHAHTLLVCVLEGVIFLFRNREHIALLPDIPWQCVGDYFRNEWLSFVTRWLWYTTCCCSRVPSVSSLRGSPGYAYLEFYCNFQVFSHYLIFASVLVHLLVPTWCLKYTNLLGFYFKG